MSFSDWTKKKKQQTSSTSSAAGQTGTRVTAPQSSNILRDDTPSDFGEWTRKKSGDALWRSEEIGFDRWMENLNNFSQRLSDDYSSRENTFQSADSFLSYQEDTNRSIDSYTRKSQEYRDYFTKYRDMYDADYGEGTVDRILSALDEGDSFLAGVRESLGNEYEFWSQFEDEDDYGTYLKGKEYAALAENDDFAEKSKYVSTYQPGTEKFNAWSGMYSNTGFGDINYDYINKNETAVGRQILSDVQTNAALLGLDNSERGEMTDDEIAIFNYIYATESPEAAYEYIDYLTADLNYRQRLSAEQEWSEYAREHPVGSSVFSVLESPLKGLSYLGQFADFASDGEIDQNEGYNKFSYINSAIRNEVNTIVEDKWGGVGSFAYTTGMSMGDFLFNTAITGGNSALTLGIMGTGAAADTTIAAKDRGLSDGQAFALGTIAGAAEIITEKFSLDALFKGDWEQGAIKYVLRNTLTEGSEEVGSDLINLFADILISKDKSEWQMSIDSYVESGMSEDEAFWHAVTDQAETMGLDFLGGAISGGVMSGGAVGINAGLNAYTAQQTGAEFSAMGDDVVDAIIEEGLASDPSTNSYQIAQQLQQKRANGEQITNMELGRLYRANVVAIDAETEHSQNDAETVNDVPESTRTAIEMLVNGEQISGNQAARIAQNQDAVALLSRLTGTEIDTDAPLSRVKSDIRSLASRSAGTSTATGAAVTSQQDAVHTSPQTLQGRTTAEAAYDMSRVRAAASSLGENGAKALTASYDGDVNADSFYAGFAAYYEAGVSGMDMEKVRSDYASALNSAQKFAAYSAGQNDAAASLTAEREGVKYATVYGDEAGFVPNEHSADLPDSTVRFYNTVARATGTKIQMAPATGEGGANGWYKDGTIYIAADAENSGTVVAKHEITHRLQEIAPEEYRKYRDYAVNALSERDGSSASLVERYKARYAESGVNLTTEQAMDEIAADFTEALVVDPARFERLSQQNRSVATKVVDAIKSFIAKVKSAFTRSGDRNAAARETFGVDLNTLEEAARLWSEALEAGSSRVKEFQAGSVFSDAGTRFSMKTPIEVSDRLIAIHNMSEDALRGAVEIGGLAMPSIAVTRAELGHTGFGEISLVFGRDTISPTDRRNMIFSGDAYTPTFPEIGYKVSDKVARTMRDRIRSLFDGEVWANDIRVGLDVDNLTDRLRRTRGDFEEAYGREDALRLAFLKDTGRNIRVPMREKTYTQNTDIKGLRELNKKLDIREMLNSGHQEVMAHEPEVREIVRNRAIAMYGDEIADQLYPSDKALSFSDVHNLIMAASRFSHDSTTREIDSSALSQRLRKIFSSKKTAADYSAWLSEFSDGIVEKRGVRNNRDFFSPSGNRRSFEQLYYDYTLSNIVKAMQSESKQGVGGFITGSGNIRGASARAYSSIEDARSDIGRIQNLTDEAKQAEYDAFDQKCLELCMDLVRGKDSRAFAAIDAAEVLTETLSKYKTEDGIYRYLKREYDGIYNVSREIAKDAYQLMKEAQQLPTNYFEAKPYRAVGFDEVLAVIAPSNMDKGLKQQLQGMGVEVKTYKPSDEADRLRKINSVKGARFSLKSTDSQGRELSESQREYFKDSVVRDSQGRLKVVYHGSTADFNEFSLQYLGTNGTAEGYGFYFTDNREIAEGYSRGTEAQRHQGANGRLYEVYLDIKKPLSNDSVTMTRAEFRRFLMEMNQKVDEDGEPLDFLANYGDVSYEGLDNVIKSVFRAEYDGSDSDVNMVHSIINGSGNMEAVFDALRKTTGYDGIVVDNASWGDGQSIYIVFHPEQIKNVDNKTPTTSPDIRYSLKYDNIGHQLSDDQAKFFENTKVVDENGNLLRVYHGSRSIAFTEFDLYEGVWLTPDRRYAEVYASDWHSWRDDYGDRTRDDINGLEAEVYDDPDLRVYELYANITNPADLGELDDALTEKTVRKLAKTLGVKYTELSEIARDYIGEYTYQLTRSREFIELAKRMGFDGFSATESGRDTFCAIYAPEQVKLVSNQTPTQNSDIRRSSKGNNLLRENAALQEENAILRERVEYWKGQTRRTQRVTTDKKAVARAARELIRSYNSDVSAEEISGDLQSLYDYIASGRDGNNELTYSEARRRSDEIARKLVENATVLEDENYRQYSDLRNFFRTTKLSVSETDSHDIADYGDFRRRNFGRMNLGKGNTNIDQVFQEASYMWPEFFDERRYSNPSDQLLRIEEVLNGIYNVEERNPFGAYLSEAVSDASNEIMERFFDLPQTRKTFADRQAARIDETRAKGQQRLQRLREQRDARLAELREQNRERVQRAVQRERETRARQIDRLKTRYATRDASARERRSSRELRARIIRHTKYLSAKLLRPSDKQHIPESLRKAVASVLESINLESVYTIDPETGKRKKGGDGDPTKRTAAFRELRQAYSNITKEGADYTLVIDPDLMDNLNEIEAMKDTPISEMGTAQLSTIWSTIKAVEASIRTANKMLGASRFQTISQVAEGIRNDNIMRSDRGDYRGALGKIDKLVNLDMLTPQGYFHRLGRTGDDIFRMLRSAQDRHIEIMHEAQRATKDIIGKLDVRKLERETHTFDLDGQKVTLSTAQIMSLYELMKRKQAQDHIFTGGIRPDSVRGGRGIRESRRADAVRVTVEDLAEITGKLTEEQIRIADGLQKYMGGRLAELGNQASMEVYGYQKFNEPDYFPIQVDKNQTQKDIAKDAQAQTIAGRGFTKSTTPKANNAVMVGSIFDIFSSHVNDMATYAAWLSTMENVRRIRDFTYRDSEGNRTGTVKSVIERVFGRNGNSYLNKLVDDLNQGVRASGSGNFMDGIIGNYKAAAVAANLRVVLQQPTAILRALNTIDAKYLIAGSVRRGDWEKVMKYAPIARWKDWGYFDINTGRQMKDVLLGSSSAMEKIKQASMAPAGKADSFAWARLWNAVEAETKDRRPGLKPGTDAFYKAVADRFSQVIDQSQVVDGILQRSQIMRSPDALTKMSTSFMAEPTKTYNMFVNAVYDLRHATGRDARKTARKVLARTSTALVVSFTVNAVMQSIADALRDDDKELEYWEKMLQAFTGFSGDEESFLDYWNSFWSGNLEANFNPLGYIPYAKDLVSIARGYDVSRMDMEPITKVWEAFTNMRKALSGDGKYSIAGASATMLSEVARLFGVPVANLKRDIQSAVTTAAIETDNYLMQYRIDKALLNIGYQGNRSGFMDILYAASINDPEAYEFIYEDMVSSGITEEQIRNAMESRMKDDQGVESVADLEKRYLTPSQEKTYDSLYGQVSGSSVWRSANQEQKDSIEEDIYNLSVGTDAGEKLMEKIEGGSSYGISEADYLLYLAAREIVDSKNDDPEKRNGSIDQEEAEAAIDMLTGLSNEARAYLWQSTNKGWKEEKNPYR